MWKLKQAAKKKAEKMASSVAAPAKEFVRIASAHNIAVTDKHPTLELELSSHPIYSHILRWHQA